MHNRRNSGLTSVPSDIPADAVEVDLSGNSITRIPSGIFSHLVQCQSLHLDNNQISQIEPGAFNGLQRVDYISLHSNQLRRLTSSMFEGLDRPLTLSLYDHSPSGSFIPTNPLICDAALCWLKQEEIEGAIIWRQNFPFDPYTPQCGNGVDWNTWVCTVPGKFGQFS